MSEIQPSSLQTFLSILFPYIILCLAPSESRFCAVVSSVYTDSDFLKFWEHDHPTSHIRRLTVWAFPCLSHKLLGTLPSNHTHIKRLPVRGFPHSSHELVGNMIIQPVIVAIDLYEACSDSPQSLKFMLFN